MISVRIKENTYNITYNVYKANLKSVTLHQILQKEILYVLLYNYFGGFELYNKRMLLKHPLINSTRHYDISISSNHLFVFSLSELFVCAYSLCLLQHLHSVCE